MKHLHLMLLSSLIPATLCAQPSEEAVNFEVNIHFGKPSQTKQHITYNTNQTQSQNLTIKLADNHEAHFNQHHIVARTTSTSLASNVSLSTPTNNSTTNNASNQPSQFYNKTTQYDRIKNGYSIKVNKINDQEVKIAITADQASLDGNQSAQQATTLNVPLNEWIEVFHTQDQSRKRKVISYSTQPKKYKKNQSLWIKINMVKY